MPLILLDVGKLVHKYCEYNLKLVTKCSVQLSVPDEFATAPSNSPQLEKLTYRDLWLARGDGLRICVELSLTESIVSCLDKPSLVEGLGQALRNAEIWPQLRLQASLTLPSVDDGPASSTADIIIFLTYSHDSTKGLGYVPRAHPPEGIAQGGLRSVNLTFCVSEFSAGKPHREKRTRLQETKVRRLDDAYGPTDGSRLCMSQSTLGTMQTFNTGMEEYQSSQPIYLSDEDVDDGSYNLKRSNSSGLRVPLSPGEATDPSPVARLQNIVKKRRADDESLHAKLGMHQLVEIIDVALRTLICDDQMLNPAGIKSLSKPVGPKLSAIAPALFSPGYHSAVSQRSHFLPRIAHVLSRMQRRSISTTLRKKLNSIADLSATVSVYGNPAMLSVDSVCDISRQIEARLWTILQRTLFDRKAARKLEPLTVPHTGFPIDPTLSEGMLEDPLRSGRETDPKSWEDGEQLYSDSIAADQDDLLLSDPAEAGNKDELLLDYQDEGYATGRVKVRDAEPPYATGAIERQTEFTASRSTRETQDLASGQYLDSESCSCLMEHVCDGNAWRRELEDSSKASSEFDFSLRQAHGSTLDGEEMML